MAKGISERKKSEQLNKVKAYSKLSSIRRKVHELLHGEKAYTTEKGRLIHNDYKNKKKKKEKKNKKKTESLEKKTQKRLDKTFKTKRTSQIESQLRNAGLSKKEIGSLRGKK